MDWKREIGLRIKAAREAIDLSQADLAEKAKIPGGGSRIGNYEQGIRTPDAEIMRKIAAALKVSPGALMFGDVGQTKSTTVPSEGETALLAKFRLLEPVNREYLLEDADKYLARQRTKTKRRA